MPTYKITKLFVLLLGFYSLNLIAAPTVEGLLRGGHNPENVFDWSVFRLKVKKLKSVSVDQGGVVQENTNVTPEGEEEQNYEVKHIKLIFTTNPDEPVKFIQVEYENPSMKKGEVVNVIHTNDLSKLFLEESFQERIVFYGTLLSLSSGNSSLLSSVLSKFNKDYKSNSNLLSQEKIDLYNEYKKYLTALKEDPELEKTLESPIRPVDVDRFSEIQKILKQDMYQDLNQVKIYQEGNRYFWKASLENFEGVFTLDKHYLRKLSLTTPQGVITAGASQYRVFSSNFYLPGIIKIKDVIEERYEVEIKHYQQFGKTELNLKDLLKNYQVAEEAETEETIEKVELKSTEEGELQTPENINKFNILISEIPTKSP
jgi:hypothetical protein